MNETKQWYESKTVWGALIAIFASVLPAVGLDLDAGAQNDMADAVTALAGAVGGLLAIYGRISADRRLG